jgi:hypothetical protein
MTLAAKILSFSGSSAANAVCHGLSGSHFVPAHAREHVDEIRSELKKAFSPSSPHHEQILDELAIRRWQVFEASRLLDTIEQDELKRGPELYENYLQREFSNHLALLQQDPAQALPYLTNSSKGVVYLLKIWGEVITLLENNQPFYPELIKQCVQALGSQLPIDKISTEAIKVAVTLLDLVIDPLSFIEEWLDLGGADGKNLRAKRLEFYVVNRQSNVNADEELLAMMKNKFRELIEIKEFFDSTENDRIRAFSVSYAGFGMKEPESTKHCLSLRRYLKTAMNRSWKLESMLQKRADTSPSKNRLSIYEYRPNPIHPDDTPPKEHPSSDPIESNLSHLYHSGPGQTTNPTDSTDNHKNTQHTDNPNYLNCPSSNHVAMQPAEAFFISDPLNAQVDSSETIDITQVSKKFQNESRAIQQRTKKHHKK